MGGAAQRRKRERVEDWELDLVRQLTASFRRSDSADLESDLMLHLLALKRQSREVENWRAYLRVALRNRARNWLRDGRTDLAETSISLNAPIEPWPSAESVTLEDLLTSAEPDLDFRIAIGMALETTDPWLAAVWKVLAQTEGNLSLAATRLRVHRNTVRRASQQIAELLERHGFGRRR